jgi:hypothetical protein
VGYGTSIVEILPVHRTHLGVMFVEPAASPVTNPALFIDANFGTVLNRRAT